mmetsp:Transcript_29769/g.54897  ORF Transcript_29769/g.54897 Transcript_29769/m.54897 type:complete len:635 (-) Transcript_29769:386-2290(-)
MRQHDRLRSLRRLRSCAMIAATSYFIIGSSSTTCLVSAQRIDIINSVMNEIMEKLCFTPCDNGYTGNEVIPGTKCQWYHYCTAGATTNIVECGDGLWYDPAKGYCRLQSQGESIACPAADSKCPSTPSPTESPAALPITSSPEENPTTEQPTMIQTPYSPAPYSRAPYPYAPYSSAKTSQPISEEPISEAPISEAPTIGGTAISHIESKKDLIEKFVLVSYGASGLAYPSTQYTMNGLMQSLQVMGVSGFGADFKFLLYEGDREKYVHGLVNFAAFLSNAMVESIEYDTCSELNWQKVEGKYTISNSCGQEGRSYQDENCAQGSTEFLSCDVDENMQVTAVSSGTQMRAPPPLKCKSGSGEEHYTGYWDTSSGREITDGPYANVAGRTDIEGCCWWGRGALSTRGVCNIGKINYYLGKRGADLGRSTLYPKLDFCRYPEVTCTSANGEQLRWTTALFEWSERIQRYETLRTSTSDGWNFEDQLAKFVDGGMVDSNDSDSFINSVSRILSPGCHESGCSESGEVRMLARRRSNFFMIINDVLELNSLLLETPKPTSKLTRQPTRRPTIAPTNSPVAMIFAPPAGLPVVLPPQEITIRPITPNPTEIQNINSSPKNHPRLMLATLLVYLLFCHPKK